MSVATQGRWEFLLRDCGVCATVVDAVHRIGTMDPVFVHPREPLWTFVVHASQLIAQTHYEALCAQLQTTYGTYARVVFRVLYAPSVSDAAIVQQHWPSIVRDVRVLQSASVDVCAHPFTIAVRDASLAQRNAISRLEAYVHEAFGRSVSFGCTVVPRPQEEYVLCDQDSEPKSTIAVSKKGKRVRTVQAEQTSLESLPPVGSVVVVQACIVQCDVRTLRNGNVLVQWLLADGNNGVYAKLFPKSDETRDAATQWAVGQWVRVRGKVERDAYMTPAETVIVVSDVIGADDPTVRTDDAPKKRIEFHVHTTMSTMDAVSSATDYVRAAAAFGHAAIGITDHAAVQSFPEAAAAAKKYGVTLLYGVEANVIDDEQDIVLRADDRLVHERVFVVCDVETTGLSTTHDTIIEIAAVKVRGGQEVDVFSSFVRPPIPIPAHITSLTGITDEMVRDAPQCHEVLNQFFTWCEDDAVIVAHNARFDVGFLEAAHRPLQHAVLDTLDLARSLFPNIKNYRLNTLAEKWNVPLDNHHRALDDTKALARILMHMIAVLPAQATLRDINALPRNMHKMRPFHCTVYARNALGKRQLYALVSESHTTHVARVPMIPKSWLRTHREHLIVCSGCEKGELFERALNSSRAEAEHVAEFYDVLEIQPVDMYAHLLDKQLVRDRAHIEQALRTIVDIGKKMGKPVIATGNAHYVHAHQRLCRDILVQGITGFHPLKEQTLPLAHFRTTEEMLEAFSFLDEHEAVEVVIEAPHRVLELFAPFDLFPKKLFAPHIDGAETELETRCMAMAKATYGDPLPEIVRLRLEKELKPIIEYGFSANYLISERLVRKSNEDGYLVGSRGSVGSSFVATLLGISEVNPLPPHYVCPSCTYSEWDLDVRSGYDAPTKSCPVCASHLRGEGQDIPFETFLGFQGDKVPDIDLNFSGEYQATAHAYTKQLFGEKNVFRAGTIGTVAERTAIGFVKKYAEERAMSWSQATMMVLALGCTGARRSTGQHPGGIIVIPNDFDIHEITPYQYPADDTASPWYTTHFDYHAFESNLLKLDILGHDDPTMMRMLYDLTGVDPRKVPLNDARALALFSSTESIGVTPERIRSPVATYGIPEMGTRFVRQMLIETKPTTFADLVQISGLSHGTGVWIGNAQELIASKTCTIKTVIGCRDDIMLYLHHTKGMDALQAFQIMELVRKGKRIPDDAVQRMRAHDVPEWYITACQRIDYMFPKAHAAAYVISAVRCAYYKTEHPIAFYAAYFSIRADDVEIDVLTKGYDAIFARILDIEKKGFQATPKEKNALSALEVALEMTARNFTFCPLDVSRSDATRFVIAGDALLPPFRVVPGLGDAAANSIMHAREQKPFVSVEDFRMRTKVSKTIVEMLRTQGYFGHLPLTNQMTFF